MFFPGALDFGVIGGPGFFGIGILIFMTQL
jgi:hypothetical protein